MFAKWICWWWGWRRQRRRKRWEIHWSIKMRNENLPRKKNILKFICCFSVTPVGGIQLLRVLRPFFSISTHHDDKMLCLNGHGYIMKSRSWVTSASSSSRRKRRKCSFTEAGNAKQKVRRSILAKYFSLYSRCKCVTSLYHHKIFKRSARDIAWTECQLTKQDFLR